MIIKRLAEGIKSQNWFVVMIEVMVVVVGIFIGLQVDAWNADRKDDLRAQEILEELNQDFMVIDKVAKELAAYYMTITADMEILLKSLAAEKMLPEDEEAIKDAISFGSNFGDPPPPSGIFRELISSGNLALIRNKDLRLRLMEYDQSINIIVESDLNININMSAFIAAFHRHATFDTKYYIPEGPDLAFVNVRLPRVSKFDFEAMLHDPEFQVAAERYFGSVLSRYVNVRVAQSKVFQIQQMVASGLNETPALK